MFFGGFRSDSGFIAGGRRKFELDFWVGDRGGFCLMDFVF
jgi:hypothetical protein